MTTSTDWYDRFDPSTYPHGVCCCKCGTELTKANVMRVDVTPMAETEPWEQPRKEETRVVEMHCIKCVVGTP